MNLFGLTLCQQDLGREQRPSGVRGGTSDSDAVLGSPD